MKALDKKVLAGLAVTILALATVAPFAEAAHRTSDSRYYRGPAVIQRSYPGRYYYQRSSSAGPALAGFFGGLLLGAVLTNHSSGQVVYRDPYSNEDFYSRQEFIAHCNASYHPREIRIVQYSSGRDYYNDCRARGYYNDGYNNGRTYDRDRGWYDGQSNGDRDYRNSRDYQGGRDYRNSRDSQGGRDYRNSRDSQDGRDYRNSRDSQDGRDYRNSRDDGDRDDQGGNGDDDDDGN